MKKLAILLVIAFVLMSANLFAEGTFRIWSDSDTYKKIDGVGLWVPAVEVTTPTYWDYVHEKAGSLPVPWIMLYGDGVKWIGDNARGTLNNPRYNVYLFWLEFDFDLPSLEYVSRATIWVACDDSAEVFINEHSVGKVRGYFQTLKRLYIPQSYIVDGINEIFIRVWNVPSTKYMGVIYYMSIDYGETVDIPETLEASHCNIVSLPLYPEEYTTFGDIFPHADSFRVVFPIRYGGVFRWYYPSTLIDSPSGDTLLYYSFQVFNRANEVLHIKGYPIYEKRFLNLWIYGHGVRSWYIGSVMCEVDTEDIPREPPETIVNIWTWIHGVGYYRPGTITPGMGTWFDFDAPYSHVDMRCGSGGLLRYNEPELYDEELFGMYAEGDTTIIPIVWDSWESGSDETPPPFPGRSRTEKRVSRVCEETHPEFELFTNSPNPFNMETEISFKIESREELPCRLAVFDIRGNEVKELLRKDLFCGYYSISWDGRNEKGEMVPSGVYLYRLELGNRSETKKMLLLK